MVDRIVMVPNYYLRFHVTMVPGRGQRHTSTSSTVQQSDSRNQASRQTRNTSSSYPSESARGQNARPQEAGAGYGLMILSCLLNLLCFP